MEERELGKTGLRVARLGFGCGAVGGLMVRGEADEQRRAIATALEAGVTYFDTAPSYGDGRSETNLGRALAGLSDAGRAIVGTKVRLSPDELARPDGTAGAIRGSLERSLHRLGRERVDLLQLHNPIRELPGADDPGAVSVERALQEIADGLQALVREGKAGHIGFTGAGDTAALQDVLERGPFETVQAYHNAINPSAVWPGASSGEQDFRGLVRTAAGRGVGVINIRVYAAGALAGDVARHPSAATVGGRPLVAGGGYEDDVARSDGPARLAAELGLENALELGLRLALAAPGISTVLVGLSSLEHLQAALRWEARGPLPDTAVDRVVELARG
jgi:aryl-alcohol dehydrogenase-like predicted oxidoreductase